MNDVDLLKAAAALFNEFAWDRLLPLVTLVVGSIIFYWMMAKAQRADPTFKAIHFLYDENGKPSWKRLIGSGCFVVHSWYIYIVTVTERATFNDIALYVVAWSGSVVLLEAIRILRGVPPAPPAQPTTDRDPP